MGVSWPSLLIGEALYSLHDPSEGPHVTKPLRHLHEVAPSTCAVLYFCTTDYIIILIYYNLWIIYIIHSIISINL